MLTSDESIAADDAVGEVWCVAVTADAGRVTAADADVVEHGAAGDRFAVERFGGAFGEFQRLVADLLAVFDEQPPQRSILRVKVPDYLAHIRHIRTRQKSNSAGSWSDQ